MRKEPFSAHPEELQIWAVRGRPPFGRGIRRWLGYLSGLVIRAFTFRYGARYSHLLLRLADTTWEATAGGVIEAQAATYCDRIYVTDVFAAPLTPEQRGRIVAWVRRAVGVPFDWPQLLRIAIAELGYDPAACILPDFGEDRLICSEFVALAYRQADIDLAADTPLWRWAPDHVWKAYRRGQLERRGRLVWTEEQASTHAAAVRPAIAPA